MDLDLFSQTLQTESEFLKFDVPSDAVTRTPFTKGPFGPISSSHPPPHTDITLFTPRIHLVPDEVNGIHTILHTLETRIDAIINDRVQRQGPTNVHLFYFHGRVTVRENDVIKNTRKVSIDP